MTRRRGKIAVAALLVAAVVLAGVLVGAVYPARTYAAEPSDTSSIIFLLNYIRSQFYKDVPPQQLIAGAMKGMVQALNDPHSEYLSPEDLNGLLQDVSGTFGGIGVTITIEDHMLTIVGPIKGTPAYEAGLQSGDRILAVDGKPMRDVTLNEASRLIRGTPGTQVTLTIERPNEGRKFDMTITRAIIQVNPMEVEFLDHGLVHITLTQFNEYASSKLDAALQAMDIRNSSGVILDLRNDPGGYLNEAIAVASRFLPPGALVVKIVGRAETENAMAQKTAYRSQRPMVVLVNEGSASASEIVAGALQANGAAELVGTKTYGKGTVQNIVSMASGEGLRLTIARFATPNGKFIEGRGIEPDLEVKMPELKQGAFTGGYLDGQRVLKSGMVGLDILALQEALEFLGYGQGFSQGVYDRTTQSAVTRFQKDHGFTQPGVADEKTIKAVKAEVAREQRTPKNDPQLKAAVEILLNKLGVIGQ
ncbi:MAG: S41 family peptidase [Bacillota bacterium]